MLEIVVVSDGYGDFLRATIPFALRLGGRLVVVTGERDGATKQLCAEFGVICLPTWVHCHAGGFDKAAAINYGLAHLACDDWLLHLDADTLLPDAYTAWRTEQPPDPACIYGADRFDCRGWERWGKLQASGWLDRRRRWGYLIDPPPFCQPCTRVGHGDFHGWLPIGHNQLWHGSRQQRYPVKPGTGGEHTDVLHAARWPPDRRRLIPDCYAIHLSTGDGRAGANWQGRVTPFFGPESAASVPNEPEPVPHPYAPLSRTTPCASHS